MDARPGRFPEVPTKAPVASPRSLRAGFHQQGEVTGLLKENYIIVFTKPKQAQ